MVTLGFVVLEEVKNVKSSMHDGRCMTHDDGQRPVAIGHSGNLN